MNSPAPPGPLDPVPAAALFGLVAGLLSVRFPYFDGLTAAMAALLLLAWGLDRRPGRGRWAGALPPRWAGGLIAGVGWLLFLAGPPALLPFRGALLGLVGLPLWWGFAPAHAPPSAEASR